MEKGEMIEELVEKIGMFVDILKVMIDIWN